MGLLNFLFGNHPPEDSIQFPGWDPRGTPINGDPSAQSAPYRGDMPIRGAIDTTDLPVSQAQQVPQERKGVFGIHGGLRNVLGALGDALSGKDTFRQGEDARDIGDLLMQGDINDPQTFAKIVAINPQIAEKIAATQGNLAYKQALLSSRQVHWGNMDDATKVRVAPAIKGRMFDLLRMAKDQKSHDALLAQAMQIPGAELIDPAELPTQFDAENQQWLGTPQDKRYNAETGRIRANETIDNDHANQGLRGRQVAVSEALVPSTIARNEGQARYNQTGADYRQGQRDGTNAPPLKAVATPPRPASAGTPAPAAAPPAGYVNKNGMKYSGRGDWRDARNWTKVK